MGFQIYIYYNFSPKPLCLLSYIFSIERMENIYDIYFPHFILIMLAWSVFKFAIFLFSYV